MPVKHPDLGIDDLATKYPLIVAEWHPIKNAELRITDYVVGSARKVWWKCAKCGYEWQTEIRHRTLRGTGCPKCADQKVGKTRVANAIKRDGCFSDEQLLLDWDWDANSAPPSEYTKCSTNVVFWKCHNCGFKWKAKIASRVKGHGCHACAGKALHIGHNDFATTEPELVKEWHPTKNGKLRPTDVMRGQARIVWWLCPNGHSYRASLNKRSSERTGCPICNSGRQTSFREQALYYYVKKIFSNAVSRYKPEWLGRMELDIYIPEKKLAIEYDGAAWHKDSNFGREKRKYELCSKHGVKLWRVKEKPPESGWGLADQIFGVDNVENRDELRKLFIVVLTALDPECDMWTRKDFRKFWTDVNVDFNRDRYEINQYRYAVKNSLLAKRPDIAAKWHPTKNHDWRPEGISWKSEHKVWWLCHKCGNEYEMTVAHRVNDNGCPICAKEKFAKTYRKNRIAKRGCLSDPELLREWNYEKNQGLTPDMFSRGCED